MFRTADIITRPLAITVMLVTSSMAQPKPEPSPNRFEPLWSKLETRVADIISKADGVMGVAISDLTDGRLIARNADQVFPTASSIKLAVLLELYRQDQDAGKGVKGKAKLGDVYTFDPKDLVEDSQIMAGL